MERGEIADVQCGRGRKRLEHVDGAGEFPIERRGIHPGRIDKPALGERAVVREGPPDQDARQHHAREHRAENQNQKVDPEGTQGDSVATGAFHAKARPLEWHPGSCAHGARGPGAKCGGNWRSERA